MGNTKENISIHCLYESCRAALINTEQMSNEIENLTYPVLKESIKEYFQTVQTDIMILTDFLVELMNCGSEADLELLLELNKNGVVG